MAAEYFTIGLDNNSYIILNFDNNTERFSTLITNQSLQQQVSSYYAALEVISTDSAFLLPRLSNAAMENIAAIPSAAVPGMILFNSDLDQLFLYTSLNGFVSLAGEGGGVTSIDIATSSIGLTVGGGPITSSGTLTVDINQELQGLSTQNDFGFLIRKGSGLYEERTIVTNGNNIQITNGDGVAGNPSINLSNTPTVNSITINNAPISPTDGVNKQYADSLVAGLDWKDPCFAATTANFVANYNNGVNGVGATLTSDILGAFTVDNVVPPLNARILIKNQIIAAQNGIYVLTNPGAMSVSWVLTRSTDYDNTNEIDPGSITAITNGDTNIGTLWLETSIVSNIGVNSITFVQFSYGPNTFLQVANNLSDLSNTAIALNNLGIFTGSNTLNGTTGVTINSSVVTTSSIINVTRNIGSDGLPPVNTIGNLVVGSIVNNTSFTVYSTVNNDIGNINWSIINP